MGGAGRGNKISKITNCASKITLQAMCLRGYFYISKGAYLLLLTQVLQRHRKQKKYPEATKPRDTSLQTDNNR